nr:G431 [uncultured bacterium]
MLRARLAQVDGDRLETGESAAGSGSRGQALPGRACWSTRRAWTPSFVGRPRPANARQHISPPNAKLCRAGLDPPPTTPAAP